MLAESGQTIHWAAVFFKLVERRLTSPLREQSSGLMGGYCAWKHHSRGDKIAVSHPGSGFGGTQ